jgi:hypothetical protein
MILIPLLARLCCGAGPFVVGASGSSLENMPLFRLHFSHAASSKKKTTLCIRISPDFSAQDA